MHLNQPWVFRGQKLKQKTAKPGQDATTRNCTMDSRRSWDVSWSNGYTLRFVRLIHWFLAMGDNLLVTWLNPTPPPQKQSIWIGCWFLVDVYYSFLTGIHFISCFFKYNQGWRSLAVSNEPHAEDDDATPLAARSQRSCFQLRDCQQQVFRLKV